MNALVVSAPNYPVSDLERMAKAFAASKLFGMQSVDQALALCLVAQAEGRHPASAAQDYHIIQGRPAKKADAMLRDFLNAGGKVEWHKLDDAQADATFSHPSGGSARIDWTMARAKQAKLTTDMWTKYPRQMLRSRVVSEGVRTVFPMATSGMYVPEEVQDFDDRAPTRHAVIQLESFIKAMKENKTFDDLEAWVKREANSIMEKLNRREQDDMQAAYEAYRKQLAPAAQSTAADPVADPKAEAKTKSLADRAFLLESAMRDCADAVAVQRIWDKNGKVVRDELDKHDPERLAELSALFEGLFATLPMPEMV